MRKATLAAASAACCVLPQLPKLSEKKKHDLLKLLACVSAGLSDMDFQEAEKCQLAGRLDEAQSRYQRICEDYPGTYDAERAKLRLKLMKRAK